MFQVFFVFLLDNVIIFLRCIAMRCAVAASVVGGGMPPCTTNKQCNYIIAQGIPIVRYHCAEMFVIHDFKFF